MATTTPRVPPSPTRPERARESGFAHGDSITRLQALWPIVTHVDRSKINLAQAVRNTLGVVAPLIVGYCMGMPRGGLAMASGALNASYSDGSDPYEQRAKRMLASAVWCSAAVLLGGLTAHSNLASVLVAAAWTFVAGMLVALGTAAADVGVISTVVLVVFAAQPLTPRQAVEAAGLALCGGLLQIFLSVALWPVRRYEPERRALGALYAELARIATHPAEATSAPLGTREIAQAHDALVNLAADMSLAALRYRSLLSQAERIRLSLVTLARLRHRLTREDAFHPAIAALDQFRENAGNLLEAVAQSLFSGKGPGLAADRLALGLALAQRLAIDDASTTLTFSSAVRRDMKFQADALGGQLRAVLELAQNATPRGQEDFAKREAARPLWLRFAGRLATLRANLTLDSVVFRHALRLMLCVAAGEAFGRMLHPYRAYWVPMTVVLVLKPEFAVTFSRGVLRITGTLIGLLLATALFHFLPIHTATEIALIGLFTFLVRSVGPANYGIFGVTISALVVLLISLTGIAPKEVIHARAVNTVLGGVLALAAYAAWPSWERHRLAELFATLLEAYRKSFVAIKSALLQPGPNLARERERTRQAARTARTNLETSLERLAVEPGVTQEQIAQANAMLASSHRFAHAMMALEAGIPVPSAQGEVQAPARREFQAFAEAAEKTLQLLSAKIRGEKVAERDFPDLRGSYLRLASSGDPTLERYALTNVEADRMTNSLNTLREQVLAWKRFAR
ncbi:MAG TPA: FUSC family protein [Candidatus Acidoferrum sp.]|nr:FUSC family protein [Candidatus Acidoferrum sp.]